MPRSASFQIAPVVTPSTTVFFKMSAAVWQVFASAPQPQRLAPPEIPRTQMLKAHFEQQNMQMMENLSQQNQKQNQDLSAQLQSRLQQFLSSSMEQMFKRFSSQSAPTDTQASQPFTQAHPSQVVEPPQQPNQRVQPLSQEPMDTSIPQAVSVIKEGLKGIKGTASIAPSTIKAIVSPSPPLPQPQSQSESPLQRLEKCDYSAEGLSTYSSTSQVDDSELENLAPPPKADFH